MEIEPMRAVGVALDQATLQETANRLGIQKRVAEMTRAQKTELIYYQIMKSTANMQGDLSRSMVSPAQAMRTMQNEINRLGRAIGSIFIPMIMKITPYIRALSQILTEVAQKIASLFGFNIKDYESDISSVGNLLTDTNTEIGDTAEDATKKMKKMLMPFDELNNIDFSKGNSGASNIVDGSSLGLDTATYDFFGDKTEEINKKVEKLKNTFKKLIPVIEVAMGIFGAMFVGIKIAQILNFFSTLKTSLINLNVPASAVEKVFSSMLTVLRYVGGAIMVIVGAFEYFKGINAILDESKNYFDGFLQSFGGTLLIAGGIALMFGAIPRTNCISRWSNRNCNSNCNKI